MSNSKYEPYGPPLNTDPPSDLDRLLDKTLKDFTDREIILESDEGMQLRNRLLLELESIFKEWVKYVAEFVEKLPEDEVAECGGQLFVSGSHRLGIKEPGADIDTVCVAPNFCTREHFFTSLKERFLAHPAVTELSAIEGSRVPILAFDFYGISIDLLFAKLAENSVPANLNIFNDDILRNLDNASEISLNGPRVTDMIRKLVQKYDTFVIVLRCVRKWAKVKGLYGNKFGYLGGVNFNLLLAFVCQLYPNASPSHLLVRFFRVYTSWKWPAPIMLNKIQPNPPGENRDIWTKEAAEYNRYANLMPIITPAYPAANSAYNVSEHTLKVMVAEFESANNVVRSIIAKKENADWGRLFTPSDFFISYNHYLLCHIVGSANGEDAEEAARGWVGFVESRLRWVPTYLSQGLQLSAVHLYPREAKSDRGTIVTAYYIGFNVAVKGKKGDEKVLRVDQCISDFKEQQLGQFRKSDGNISNTFIVEHFTWKNLPENVFDPLGGKAVAKEMRRAKLRGNAPVVKTEVAAPVSSADAEKAPGDVTEAGGSKKRKLDDEEENADDRDVKRVRAASEEGQEGQTTSLGRVKESDGVQDFGALADGAAENETEHAAFQRSALSKSEHLQLAAEVQDLSGRGFVPQWRRTGLSKGGNGAFDVHLHHHHHDSKPIHVTWSLLETTK